jgi:hypothetical protein
MPFTIPEGFEDLQPAVKLFNKVDETSKALPPADQRKAVDYAKCIGAAPGEPLMLAAELIDTVQEQIKS